jgi:hypothetical protein
MLRGKNLTRWPWPLTWKINMVPDSPKDYVCTKFGQNPFKDLILECSQGCYTVQIWPCDIDLWPMTLKINRVPDPPKDEVCTKFCQNPLKDLDSRVFTRMLCGKKLPPRRLTLKINMVPDSPKDYVCTKFGQNPFKDLILECSQGCYTVQIWPCDIDLWPMTLKINRVPDPPKDEVCTKFCQNPLKDLDSRVFTRMLCGKKLPPRRLTLKINRVPDSPKD